MNLPEIKAKKDAINFISQFGGVNKGLNISNNEFEDMQNMSNDYFPVIATRKKRGIIKTLTKCQGVCSGDRLTYIDDDVLYYNDSPVLTLSAGQERQIVRMGAYICIFPDGIVYNTITDEVETIENTVTTTSTVTMRMCKLDGTEFDSDNTHIGDQAPEDPSEKPYWLDTSSSPVILKIWSDSYSMWTSVATTYVKISSTGIGTGFKAYDSVKFSGLVIKGFNDYDFNQNLIVYAAGEDYLIVAGLIDLYYTQEAEVTAKRELPLMDFVCEMDNRLYGCRYGLNNAGEFVNEVYASKIGDPTNWNAFAGLDSDSYAARSEEHTSELQSRI